MICKKCNGCRVTGPHYRRDGRGERLVYSCLTCGYQWGEPTADSKQDGMPRLPKQYGGKWTAT